MKYFVILLVLCSVFVFFPMAHQSDATFFQASRFSQIIASGNDVFVTWEESTENEISVLFRKSSDGGKTFGETVEITSDIGIAVPKLMAVSENNIYVTWGSESDKSPQVLFRKSSDNGNTFKPVITLSDSDKICSEPYDLLATGSNVYVFFNCYVGTSNEGSIVFRASHDYGNTFEKPIIIFKGKNIYANVIVSATANGKNVFVAFQNSYDTSNPSDIIFRSSYDGGISFNDSFTLSDGKFWYANPQILASNNNVYVTWIGYDGNDFKYLFFKKSDDDGKTFGNLITLEETKSGDVIGSIPSIVANNGYVYVKWGEFQFIPNSNKQITTFFFRTSTDGGNNFGPITDVFEKPRSMLDFTHSMIQSGTDQNIYLMWPQTTNAIFDTVGIFFKKSVDGGKTFGDVIDLNKKNYLSHQIIGSQLAVSENNVYVAGDTQDKGHEIFFVASHDHGETFGKITDLNERNHVKQKIVSPFAQIKSGIAVQNIACKDGFVLVIRNHDKIPACVRTASLAKLISSGWSFGIDDKAENAIKDTRQIITIGDKIPNTVNGLVPVTITQVTNITKPTDSITVWTFQPIGHNGDDIRKTWNILPNSYYKSEIVDEYNNTAIDPLRMPESFGIPLDLHIYPTICGSNEKVEGESGHPMTYPIKKGVSQVFAKNTERGLLPDSNGEYTIDFVSLFETKIEFPKDAQIILNETKSCILQSKIDDFSKSFYSKVVFKMRD